MSIEKIGEIFGELIGLAISIAIGLWVLSMFLPVEEFFTWVKGLFSGKGKVMLRCKNCKKTNPEDAEFCSSCGKEL